MNEIKARSFVQDLRVAVLQELKRRYANLPPESRYPQADQWVVNSTWFSIRKQPIHARPPEMLNATLPVALETKVFLDHPRGILTIEHLGGDGPKDAFSTAEHAAGGCELSFGGNPVTMAEIVQRICDPIFNSPGNV